MRVAFCARSSSQQLASDLLQKLKRPCSESSSGQHVLRSEHQRNFHRAKQRHQPKAHVAIGQGGRGLVATRNVHIRAWRPATAWLVDACLLCVVAACKSRPACLQSQTSKQVQRTWQRCSASSKGSAARRLSRERLSSACWHLHLNLAFETMAGSTPRKQVRLRCRQCLPSAGWQTALHLGEVQ
jgi:hypothetical protein